MKKLGVVVLFLMMAGRVEAAYRIGVDYHSTGADFASTPFIAQYQKPEVRALVRSQLQAMADSGAKVINTRLWMVDPPEARFPTLYWRLQFPISAQETANLRQYVKDVAEIKTPDGSYLDLYLTILGNGCAGYNGEFCNYPWSKTVELYKQSFVSIIGAVGDLVHSDNTKVVSWMYFTGEAMVGQAPGTDRYLKDLYPFFVNECNTHGLKPTLYFLLNYEEKYVLNDNYVDSTYPILNKHQSLMYIYRTTEFMRQNNLPIPDRLDFSFYETPETKTDEALVKRAFDDLVAVYPGKTFGVSETHYSMSKAKRQSLGAAFANEANRRGLLKELFFWTSPTVETDKGFGGFPYDFTSYYPGGLPVPCNQAFYFNTQTKTCAQTVGKYTKSMYYCDDTSVSCVANLNTFLPGVTTGKCYETQTSCQNDSGQQAGDYNGDGKVDLMDFGSWKMQYLAGQKSLADYVVWKKAYLGM